MPDKRLNPRQDGQDSLGMPDRKWGGVFAKELNGMDAVQLTSYMHKMLLRRKTAYTQGAVVFSQNIPAELVLECTASGTTAAVEPAFVDPVEDGTVEDGSVVWTYRGLLSGSGGGALNIIKLTQAEYDVLTPEEKIDSSKMYMIIDSGPSIPGGGVVLNIEELTREQYDALTDEQKKDYTMLYVITDDVPGTVVDGVPVGIVSLYSAGGVLPAGYLPCDGSGVSRTQYSQLFSKIGTTYGPGDGSTTFNLPSLVGEEPGGVGVYVIKALV